MWDNKKKEEEMKYKKKFTLKNGQVGWVRNGEDQDAKEILQLFTSLYQETDHLIAYPDENSLTLKGEEAYLREKKDAPAEVSLIAEVDGKIVAIGGLNSLGSFCKIKHRSSLGIAVKKDYWGQGIGEAISLACIECGKKAGYGQVELEVLEKNLPGIGLYEKLGFKVFGRNPRGFRSREGDDLELILMAKTLD